MQNKRNRREMLKLMGVTAGGAVAWNSPMRKILESILNGVSGRAYAEEMGIAPRKWVDFRLDNAPPRWVYDLILRPYAGGAGMVANPMVATRYTGSSVYDAAVYETVKMNGIDVPYLWQFEVPSAAGGTRSMAPLLDNFMNVRGMYTNNTGHEGSQTLHYLPLGSTHSLSALSADASSAPLPGVMYNTSMFQFQSERAKSAVTVSGTNLNNNLISSLLGPFLGAGNDNFKTRKAALKDILAAARYQIGQQARSVNANFDASINAVESAHGLIERTFGDLGAVWTSLYSKYQMLIYRSLDPDYVMAGINDKPIGVAATSRGKAYQMEGSIVQNDDLRTMIRLNYDAANNVDPATSTNVMYMAEAFAIAEFVLTRGLSDSLTVGWRSMKNVKSGATNVVAGHDEHLTGSMTSLLINTYSARAHAACMLEFIDRLKDANLFNETLINVSGEFNRSPLNSGEGSDHGDRAASLALYSGAIRGPIVIGNIAANSPVGGHGGTWGYGVGTDALGGQILDLGHMGSTVAKILRVPSPVTARPSLVKETDQGIVPVIELGKTV